MSGKILNSALRADISRCHCEAVKFATDRAGLIAIWRAAKLTLGENSSHLEAVTRACSTRAAELEKIAKAVK